MEEKKMGQEPNGVNRRRFLGALGAAAAAGAMLETGGGALAQSPATYYFENSFGEIVPVSQDAINAGIPLPPLVSPNQAGSDTAPPERGATAPRRSRPTAPGRGHAPLAASAAAAAPASMAPRSPPTRSLTYS